MPHRFAIVVVIGVAAGALLLAAHVSAAPQPGRTIIWSTPAALPPPASGSASLAQAAAPTVTPRGLLGGLSGPLSAIFSRLNGETQRSAAGQLSILQEIAGTLKGWIEHLLNSATAG